jgi:CRP-like cAMP-binding protein
MTESRPPTYDAAMAIYDRALYQTYLHSIPMFASCTTEQIDHLAGLGEADAVTDGTEIVSEGAMGDSFYVITSGNVRITRGGSEVGKLTAGDYFGELALFDPAPRNATVTAEGTVSLVSISRDNFTAALDEAPGLRDTLLHGMARRLHELDARA